MRYTRELLQEAVDNSTSYSGVLRYFGVRQAGGTQSHVKRRIQDFDIDTKHFTGQGHMKGKRSNKRLRPQQILVISVKGSRRVKTINLRRAMLESGAKHECIKCGNNGKWNEQVLILEIDHVNGDWLDNTIENLRFLCPNCHSQEPTNRSWKTKYA